MKRGAIYILIACFFTFVACQQRNGNNSNADDSKEVAEEQNEDRFDNKMEKDAEFAVNAAEDNMLGIRLAQLAESNASSSEVKSFAKAIIADHNKTGEELTRLAMDKGITLPASLSDRCQKKYDNISGKSGREFDEAYADFMVKEHKDVIDNFKEQAKDGNDPEIKQFAASKVASLEHHLTMAEDLEDMVKKADRASND